MRGGWFRVCTGSTVVEDEPALRARDFGEEHVKGRCGGGGTTLSHDYRAVRKNCT